MDTKIYVYELIRFWYDSFDVWNQIWIWGKNASKECFPNLIWYHLTRFVLKWKRKIRFLIYIMNIEKLLMVWVDLIRGEWSWLSFQHWSISFWYCWFYISIIIILLYYYWILKNDVSLSISFSSISLLNYYSFFVFLRRGIWGETEGDWKEIWDWSIT